MPAAGPDEVAFAIRGPIARADLPGLCDRVCALLRTQGPGLVVCDVQGVEPSAVTVEALARLQLAARRVRRRVALRAASEALLELVDLMGLTDVLPSDDFRGRSRSRVGTTQRSEKDSMTNGARMIFPNLAMKDLDRAVAFFGGLGFSFDPRFTDESAAAMVVNEQAVVMLLAESKFKEFTTKELVDSTRQTEAIIALSAESREDVDAFADKALALGGSPANDPTDLGFMYGRSFSDPDGHLWEIFWMDPVAAERGPAEAGVPAA
jgi:hypothetical protein